MRKGRQTLGQLIPKLDVSARQAKEAILILIQHNIVTFAESVEKGRNLIFYQVVIENIFLRDRYGAFIYFSRTRLGGNVPIF
jgi:hypothetical protein